MITAILAIIAFGIAGVGIGLYLLWSRSKENQAQITPKPRRRFERRACGGCGKSFAMRADGELMHHNETDCIAYYNMIRQLPGGAS